MFNLILESVVVEVANNLQFPSRKIEIKQVSSIQESNYLLKNTGTLKNNRITVHLSKPVLLVVHFLNKYRKEQKATLLKYLREGWLVCSSETSFLLSEDP